MTRKIKCRVSQHAVRNLGWGVFGAIADILRTDLPTNQFDSNRTQWSATSALDYDVDGRVMIVYEVRGKEIN